MGADTAQTGSSNPGDLSGLAAFRRDWYGCLRRRADALFELSDAVLCADGPVLSLPELSLSGVHRRGHGALYDALAEGQINLVRLRVALAGLPLPRAEDRQLTVAIDVTGVAPPGRGVFAGPAALSPAMPLRRGPADNPRLALLGGRRAGPGTLLVDRPARRCTPRARR